MFLQEELLKWYEINKRDLPWRNTRDPYLIWLSEIILQQTRVDQGIAYYYKFSEKYSDVSSLAEENEDEILKLWQGLGYYSRARNLHTTAKEINSVYDAVFPSEYKNIRALKGVGDYTAAAIASFAFDLPYAVVDGNVYRVLARYFGIETPIDSPAGKKEFALLANDLIKNYPSSVYNQAIMEFGALQCTYANPLCMTCPLVSDCVAFNSGTINFLPVKKNKTTVRDRYFHYFILKNDDSSFFIRKRNEKDIWQGLHDFPLIESETSEAGNEIVSSSEWKSFFGESNVKILNVSEEYKHVLSHQIIHAKFYEINADASLLNENNSEWKKVNHDSVQSFAVPKLIERYLGRRVSE